MHNVQYAPFYRCQMALKSCCFFVFLSSETHIACMHTPDTLGALSNPSMFMLGVAWSGYYVCVHCGVWCCELIYTLMLLLALVKFAVTFCRSTRQRRARQPSFTFIMPHNLPDCSELRNTTECNVIDCDCMECGHCWLLLVVCVLCSWCWWVWISILIGPSFNDVPDNVSLASGT